MRRGLSVVAAGLLLCASAATSETAGEPRALEGLDPDLRAALVAIEVVDEELLEVFGQVRDQSLANVAFDEDVRLDRPITFTGRGRLAEVVPALAHAAGLAATSFNQQTLLIFPDTPAKRWEYSAANPANAPEAPLPRRAAGRTLLFDEEEARVRDIFDGLARESGLTIRLDPEVDADELIAFRTDVLTMQETIDLLLLRLGLTYVMEGRRSLLVYPARAEKMFEHGDPRTEGLTPRDFLAPHER